MSQNLGNLTLVVFLDINPRSPWKINGTVGIPGIPISFQISQELRNAILSAGPAGAQSFAAQAFRENGRGKGIENDPFIDGLAIMNGEEGNSNNNFRAY
jgi:hypothetical protein